MESQIQQVLTRLHERINKENVLYESLASEQFSERIDEFMLAVGEEAGKLLNLLVKLSGSRSILEIGTSVGYSTLWLAEAARATGGKIISFDTVADKHAQARENLADAGLLDQVKLVTGDAVAEIASLPGPFDFVLLDAWKDIYIPAFEAIHPKLVPGGLVTADNIIFPESEGAQAYLRHVQSHPGYETVTLPIGHGIELTRKQV